MEELVPKAEEVRDQLERMLAGKRFKAASNQADFLSLVVARALEGKKTSEEIIGRKLFGAKFKKDESTDVRVTASNLRKTLVLYNENEGRGDPITILLPEPPSDRRIKLPPGEAYRPIFAYNPYHEIAREYRLGLYFLSPPRPHELANALEHFIHVREKDAGHFGANIGIIEATCLLAFMGWGASVDVYAALQRVPAVIALGPKHWHAHAACGAAWLLGAEIEKAKEAFETALRLDKRQTLQYGWYHAFLLATDRQAEALHLAQARADARPEDATVNAIYGAYLYANRQFETAEAVLKNAIELDPNCWIVHLVLALVTFAKGDASEAFFRLRVMEHSLQAGENCYFYPGLSILIHEASEIRYEPSLRKHAARKILKETPSPIQLSLYFISVGMIDEAVTALKFAWRSYEPLVLFLSVLPLFDPLRGNEDFQAIVQGRHMRRPDVAEVSELKWSHKVLETPEDSNPQRP